jgi:hypothetical protein
MQQLVKTSDDTKLIFLAYLRAVAVARKRHREEKETDLPRKR